MKVLVLGSTGMLGHMLVKYFKKRKIECVTVARNNADYNISVEEQPGLLKLKAIIEMNFDYVINCIGCLPWEANIDPARAVYLNAWFPHFLEKATKATSSRIIQISTDCVFNGDKGNYTEMDPHTEMNYYGRSKSLGEIINTKDVTFRMSLFGPEIKSPGRSLMSWLINQNDSEIYGWDDALLNGITTLQLAKSLEKYMYNPVIVGAYHLVNNDLKISRYELLSLINTTYCLDKKISRGKGPQKSNKTLVDTKKIIDFNIPTYEVQLAELKEFSCGDLP